MIRYQSPKSEPCRGLNFGPPNWGALLLPSIFVWLRLPVSGIEQREVISLICCCISQYVWSSRTTIELHHIAMDLIPLKRATQNIHLSTYLFLPELLVSGSIITVTNSNSPLWFLLSALD